MAGNFGSIQNPTSIIYIGAGSVAAPSFTFGADSDSGIYNPAANRVGIGAGGVEYLTIGSTGAAGAIHSGTVGGFDNTISSAGNAAVFYAIHTDGTNSLSHSAFIARVTAGGGDGYFNWNVSGVTNWTAGVDNDQGDRWALAEAASLGTVNDRIRIPTGGQIQVSDGSAGAPVYSFINDTDSGIYSAGANEVGIALGGAERFRVNTANTANDIRIAVYDHTAAAMRQVSRGAADSGGAGFRVLRIPN